MKLTFYQRIFLKMYRNNSNETHHISTDVKNNLKQRAMEQGVYSQVVMIFRTYLNITEANKNENEHKFKFQGHSAISQHEFDLDFDWYEEMFSTVEPDFNKKIYQDYAEKKIQIR